MGEANEHRVSWLFENGEGFSKRQEGHLKAPDEQAKRDLAEIMRLRANLLAGDDRILLEAYLKGGGSVRQIARLAGVKPSSVWGRIRRIIRRLYDSTYLLCVEDPCGLTAAELAIVKDNLVRGLSIKDISRKRNLSYYRVRSTILKAKRRAATHRHARSLI